MSSDQTPAEPQAPAHTFADFNLPDALLRALVSLGYEQPTPIQAATLPPLLKGRDLVGQAQTGTGKTAAFALPVLARIDANDRRPQVLVLTPTRELCIQVAEAFHQYATNLKNFRVLPVYGGTDFRSQLRGLKHGAQVVVGTPGRLMDHMRRGTLDLSALSTVVLDEADEMLRMGFIDDVEWILEQTPQDRQTLLFSATMPAPVRRIATKFLKDPKEVTIESKQRTADTIHQRWWLVDGLHKLDALTRILETEEFDGMLVFVRTKVETEELSRRLEARGWAATPLNGDIAQAQREKVVDRFKAGRFDVLVATDVVARGLDVERISHVVNYDIPYDTEAYVHRIGRTGRAGRKGEAILFVGRRERGMLRAIERATSQTIERMDVPSTDDVAQHRVRRFQERISETLAGADDLGQFQDMLEKFQHDEAVPMERIAAALASMSQGERPLFKAEPETPIPARRDRTSDRGNERDNRGQRPDRAARGARPERGAREQRDNRPPRPPRDQKDIAADAASETFRIEVGHDHGVQPGNIVGAIANEAGMDAQHIGRIRIREDHSLVDLPEGMPKEIFQHLQDVWVSGQKLRISKADAQGGDERPAWSKPAGNKARAERPNRDRSGPERPRRERSGQDRPERSPRSGQQQQDNRGQRPSRQDDSSSAPRRDDKAGRSERKAPLEGGFATPRKRPAGKAFGDKPPTGGRPFPKKKP